MKVIIAGGRDFIWNMNHKNWLIKQLNDLKATHVICGMAKGADLFGKYVGEELGLKILEYPADWNRFGMSAGPKRNIEMLKVADACILFPGGKGTEHMRSIAINKLIVIEYDSN